jgi:hypothetical protein
VGTQYVIVEIEDGTVSDSMVIGCQAEVIVLDWDMLESSGDDAVEKLRELRSIPEQRSLAKIIERIEAIIEDEDEDEEEDEDLLDDEEDEEDEDDNVGLMCGDDSDYGNDYGDPHGENDNP